MTSCFGLQSCSRLFGASKCRNLTLVHVHGRETLARLRLSNNSSSSTRQANPDRLDMFRAFLCAGLILHLPPVLHLVILFLFCGSFSVLFSNTTLQVVCFTLVLDLSIYTTPPAFSIQQRQAALRNYWRFIWGTLSSRNPLLALRLLLYRLAASKTDITSFEALLKSSPYNLGLTLSSWRRLSRMAAYYVLT